MNHFAENSAVLAVLFVVIAIPVYFVRRNARQQKSKEITGLLAKIELEHQLHLQHIDYLDSFVLALDEERQMLVQLFFHDHHYELTDLKTTERCMLLEKKQGSSTHTIELVLADKKQLVFHRIAFYKQFQDNEMYVKRTAQKAAQWEILLKRLAGPGKLSPASSPA